MQDELDAMGLPVEVDLLGVNGVGFELGNDSVTMGRDIPWLQPDASNDPWITWGVQYRDVVILDEQNYPVAVYNLTQFGLMTPANYDTLKGLFVQYATD